MWSVRALVESAVQHGRRALQQVHQRQPTLVKQSHTCPGHQASHKLSKCGSERSGGAVRRVAEGSASSAPSPAATSSVVTRLVQGIVRKVSAPLWTEARRRATKRLVFEENAPFFALVGVTLVSGSQQGLVTKEDELEALCCNIRDAVSHAGWLHDPSYWHQYQSSNELNLNDTKEEDQEEPTLSLSDFKLGPVIGKGCNAAVYAACFQSGNGSHFHPPDLQKSKSFMEWETNVLEEIQDSPSEDVFVSGSEEGQHMPVLEDYISTPEIEDITQRLDQLTDSQPLSSSLNAEYNQRRVKFKLPEKLQRGYEASVDESAEALLSPIVDDSVNDKSLVNYPLAIKMMFNYEAESNAPAILRAMYKELLPARCVQLDEAQLEWQERLCGKMTRLPPHSNIVEMPFVFVDRVPLLEDSMSLYPNALPSRLNPGGYGRNMSLFCVMKRYDISMREYLSQHRPSEHTSLLLLTQLLEALLHISTYNVAHRDLKADNILISLSEGWEYPLLVLTDFGCSITSETSSITASFPSYDADPRQGNPALMAPEVITAVPGLLRSVNFSHSDLWAAGALAYEIYGYENPFFTSQDEVSRKKQKSLNSASYKESQLPRLAKSVPPTIRRLIHDLLRRNPRNRPSATIAATLCQLILWAPSKWLSRHALTLPTHNEITQWLLCLTTKVLCEARLSGPTDRHGKSSMKKSMSPEEEIGCFKKRDRHGGQLEYMLVSTLLSRVHYSDVIQAIKWNRAF